MKTRHINPSQAALIMKVSRQRVHALLKEGRFQGAHQLYPGGPWLIPVHDGKLQFERKPVGRPRKRQ